MPPHNGVDCGLSPRGIVAAFVKMRILGKREGESYLSSLLAAYLFYEVATNVDSVMLCAPPERPWIYSTKLTLSHGLYMPQAIVMYIP